MSDRDRFLPPYRRWDPDDESSQHLWPQHVDDMLEVLHAQSIANLHAIKAVEKQVTILDANVTELRQSAFLLTDDDNRRAMGLVIAHALRELRRQDWRNRWRRALRNKFALVGGAIPVLYAAFAAVKTAIDLFSHH